MRSAKCGVLLQTVCMQLGILFNIPVQRAQLLRRLQTELKRRTCIVSHLSLALPSCGCLGRPLRTGCLGPKIAPNVFLRCLYFSICVVSTGLGTSHWPQERELYLTICLSHHCAVYFAFLLVATLGRRFSRLSYHPLHSHDRPGSVFFPTSLPTWLSICLPSCGGFATEEFLRLSCFERYHSLSLMAAMLLICHLIVIIGCRVSNMFSAK